MLFVIFGGLLERIQVIYPRWFCTWALFLVLWMTCLLKIHRIASSLGWAKVFFEDCLWLLLFMSDANGNASFSIVFLHIFPPEVAATPTFGTLFLNIKALSRCIRRSGRSWERSWKYWYLKTWRFAERFPFILDLFCRHDQHVRFLLKFARAPRNVPGAFVFILMAAFAPKLVLPWELWKETKSYILQ